MFNRHKIELTSTDSGSSKQDLVTNQQGIYLIFSAVVISVLFAIVALGIEVGRWYAIQAEVSKAVDGAAFAGAANAGNFTPVQLEQMVKDVATANFPDGMIGTENLMLNVADDGSGKITVDGTVDAVNPIASVLGHGRDKTPIGAQGVAKLRKFEIVLVLDQSGSMRNAMGDLKTAAVNFVQSFQALEGDPENKMGLVTFASGVVKRNILTDAFVAPVVASINGLNHGGYTNAEESLDRAQDLDMGWSDQTIYPPNERAGQYILFFSDGQPTAFTSDFSRNGSVPTDAVVKFDGAFRFAEPTVINNNYNVGGGSVAVPSGNGVGSTKWRDWDKSCGGSSNYKTVKWWVLDPSYDQDGYGNNNYSVARSHIYGSVNPLVNANHNACHKGSKLANYGDLVAQQMAVDHASEIKNNKEYQIYTVGLGNVDPAFLGNIASGPEFELFASNSAQLAAKFAEIASRIKLVLIK